jgi:hypothetical protein
MFLHHLLLLLTTSPILAFASKIKNPIQIAHADAPFQQVWLLAMSVMVADSPSVQFCHVEQPVSPQTQPTLSPIV